MQPTIALAELLHKLGEGDANDAMLKVALFKDKFLNRYMTLLEKEHEVKLEMLKMAQNAIKEHQKVVFTCDDTSIMINKDGPVNYIQ